MTFALAHISDLHVSEFGDSFHDRAHQVRRTPNVVSVSTPDARIVWEQSGWRVVQSRGRRGALDITLVDPGGYAHPVPPLRRVDGSLRAFDPIERAAAKARRLEARRATTLAQSLPSAQALGALVAHHPRGRNPNESANVNVRLLRALDVLQPNQFDAVAITGDVTDDGAGWELIESAFAPWIKQNRLFVIAGNHDLYLLPMRASTRPRPTARSKRQAWHAFAAKIGLELDASGGWMRTVPEAHAVIVGLDSCARPQKRFFRQNGAIGEAQLAWLRRVGQSADFKRAFHRIVMFHHHLVPLAHGVGRRTPPEIGMRLDDAREAARVFDEVGVTAVLHGHRHVSEQRQPAGANFTILASPSLTLGCRSGDGPSFWKIELDARLHATRVRVPMEAMAQDDDDVSA